MPLDHLVSVNSFTILSTVKLSFEKLACKNTRTREFRSIAVGEFSSLIFLTCKIFPKTFLCSSISQKFDCFPFQKFKFNSFQPQWQCIYILTCMYFLLEQRIEVWIKENIVNPTSTSHLLPAYLSPIFIILYYFGEKILVISVTTYLGK